MQFSAVFLILSFSLKKKTIGGIWEKGKNQTTPHIDLPKLRHFAKLYSGMAPDARNIEC